WGEWVARNLIVLGNWSEYQLENAVLVKRIMESEEINLGYLLQQDIKRIASSDAAVFTLGHCNLITALCRRSKVPEEGEDDSVLEPVKSLDYEYFHARFSAGPVNNRGDHGGHDGNEEVGEEQDQGMQDV
ncbi:hypothetical protein A2U01_0058378, partial [Trifolium medium]|nr:hypothetical protein [Trifolium medium]